ncbi:nuclear transport factor 2 family protein [Actinophytocola sp.]|uniref:nuclear transport factor 2 family protein n=1 Tax=Actinophytocola sp. TaxID=1872138 RepID=UPI002ED0F520
MIDGHQGIEPSAATTAAGVDHVRLAYDYIDAGEFDAYSSLLDENMQLRGLGPEPAHGRGDVVRSVQELAGPPGWHELYKIIASGECVVAIGRYVPAEATSDVEFADAFVLSEDGLLLSQRRFRYLPGPAKP